MDDFLRTQIRQHPEVDLHITLSLFEHRAPGVEVSNLNQRVEVQSNTLRHMENSCKARVDLLI